MSITNRKELGSLAEYSENASARTASAILTINSPPETAGRTLSCVPSGRTPSYAPVGRTLSSTEVTTLDSTDPAPPLTPVVASGGTGAAIVPMSTPESSSLMDPLKLEAPGAPTKKPKRDASPSSDEYEDCAEEGYGGRTLSRVTRRRKLSREALLKADETMPTREEIDKYADGTITADDAAAAAAAAAAAEATTDDEKENQPPSTQEYVPNADPEPVPAGAVMDVAHAG